MSKVHDPEEKLKIRSEEDLDIIAAVKIYKEIKSKIDPKWKEAQQAVDNEKDPSKKDLALENQDNIISPDLSKFTQFAVRNFDKQGAYNKDFRDKATSPEEAERLNTEAQALHEKSPRYNQLKESVENHIRRAEPKLAPALDTGKRAEELIKTMTTKADKHLASSDIDPRVAFKPIQAKKGIGR